MPQNKKNKSQNVIFSDNFIGYFLMRKQYTVLMTWEMLALKE